MVNLNRSWIQFSGKDVILMRRFFTALLVLVVLMFTSGCETMSGFGRDVERGGQSIQDKAD